MHGKMKVLFISLDKAVGDYEVKLLQKESYVVEFCDSLVIGKNFVQEEKFNIVIFVVAVDKAISSEVVKFLHLVKKRDAFTQVVVMGRNISLSVAVQALECGAHDYLLLPVDDELFLESIHACVKKIHRWQAAIRDSIKFVM